MGSRFRRQSYMLLSSRISDSATANAISTFSNVARQDIYRTLGDLQEIGLVEKIVTSPSRFKAVSMEDAISVLVEKRKGRTRVLIEESTELLAKFPDKASVDAFQDVNQFILIPKREAVVRRIEKANKASHEKTRIIVPWREFTQWMFTLHKLWQQAIERGVKLHWIIDGKPQDSDSNLEMLHNFLRNPEFRVRILPQLANKRIGIFDHREVFIATTANSNASGISCIMDDQSHDGKRI